MASTKKRSPLAPEFCNALQGVAPEDLHAFNTQVFTSHEPQASSVEPQAPEETS